MELFIFGMVALIVFCVLVYVNYKPRELKRTETPISDVNEIRRAAAAKQGEFAYAADSYADFTVQVGQTKMPRRLKFSFRIVRNLAAMSHREREFVKIYQLMRTQDWLTEGADNRIQFGLVWGDGSAVIDSFTIKIPDDVEKQHGIKTISDAIRWYANELGVNVESAISELLNAFGKVQSEHAENPLVKELTASISSGSRWFTEQDIAGSVFEETEERPPLLLGTLHGQDSKPVSYFGEGSLVTIAPPGAGKTQCHIIPNLLRWQGPAVVLDLKGELWQKTSKFRNALGPVYRFAPFEPERSHHFNPLSAIRSRPDLLWEDSVALAELMIIPQAANDPFWEQSAQRVLAGFIAYVCRKSASSDGRSMGEILDLANGLDLPDFFARASIADDVKELRRVAKGFEDSPDSVRGGILSQLQTGLKAWAGGRVERVTGESNWTPDVIRERNATLYICIKPGEIEPALSILRVMIGQHINALTNTLHDRTDVKDVLFFVDEFPQLKEMRPIETGIAVGRSYGVRLWLIAQSLAQVRSNYPKRGDGMLGSCGLQAYMNPPLQDGTAQKVSDEIGFFESVIDRHRQPIAEPQALAGPDFNNDIIVIAQGCKPMRLNKLRAFEDDVSIGREGETTWPPAQPPESA
ncbi:MAG: type IV secretory system conjugative DNA transfer family protein [Hyphomicrobiaceae bacterium]|nr:type IV secretory system conjugative DNA transfer family protein [Hyphomicrobiaceae bacterium]